MTEEESPDRGTVTRRRFVAGGLAAGAAAAVPATAQAARRRHKQCSRNKACRRRANQGKQARQAWNANGYGSKK